MSAACTANLAFAEADPTAGAVGASVGQSSGESSGASADPQPVARRIIKFQFEDKHRKDQVFVSDQLDHRLSAAGIDPYDVQIDNPFVGSGSFHLEVQAPSGTEIVTSSLELSDHAHDLVEAMGPNPSSALGLMLARAVVASPQTVKAPSGGQRGAQTHCYASETPPVGRARGTVQLRAKREGLVSNGYWVALTITLVLMVYAIWGFRRVGAAPAALPLIPSLVALVTSTAGEHALTIRMLAVARRFVLASGFCAFTAVVVLSTVPSQRPTLLGLGEPELVNGALTRSLIAALAVISLGCTFVLYFARRFPRNVSAREDNELVDVPRVARWVLEHLLMFPIHVRTARRFALRKLRRI